MNKKQRVNLVRICITGAVILCLALLPVTGWPRFALYMAAYAIIGYDILRKAFLGLKNRQPLDENLLMAVATLGAIGLAIWQRTGEYTEAIAVMLFYQIGEWFQSYAVGKSRSSISALMDIAPDYANMEDESGQLQRVDPEDVETGSLIIVMPGERIPLDGTVEEGTSTLDTAALTGESIPREARPGDQVLSGCINGSGVLRIRTTKEYDESTATRVLELIEDASSRKSRSEAFITRFARVYTPAVVSGAVALALLPPVISLMAGIAPAWSTWIYRALTFLVISCPCALVVSIPLSFFAGIGGASRQGILIKGSNYLEALARTRTMVFDKTGTLTRGVFEVVAVHPREADADRLLRLAAQSERYSSHPIAQSLKNACTAATEAGRSEPQVENVREIAGQGILAEVDGTEVAVGNTRLMATVGAAHHDCHLAGTVLHVALNGSYAGHIVISDVMKPTSRKAVEALRKNGVTRAVMLTGDTQPVADRVARELGIGEVYSNLLPQDKVARVETLMQEQADSRAALAFVGDGINDAPVLSRADVGIAMGALGSDAAIEAADVVLMNDDPLKTATALIIARKCMRIVKENIVFAIGIKVLCLAAGAFGLANMWWAIFADVGVMVLAVLNAIRCLFAPRGQTDVSAPSSADQESA